MALVLFDIGGTLVLSGKNNYKEALIQKHLGKEYSLPKMDTRGKTDRKWLLEAFQANGIENAERDARYQSALQDMGNIYRIAQQDQPIQIVPNVEKLLKALREQNHTLGLLTGNTREKANAKLEKTGFLDYFSFGVFGEEAIERHELVSMALQQAEKITGKKFAKTSAYVIGDTLLDVQSAKKKGIKTIAISTGEETYENLSMEKPDFLFRDFSDIEEILKAIR